MNSALVAQAAASLEIMQINLGSHTVSLADTFTSLIDLPPSFINLQWGPRRAALLNMHRADDTGEADTLWNVWFRTVARYVEGQAQAAAGAEVVPASAIATLEADWIVQYRVKPKAAPPEEALQEFSIHNVPVHVWPYWREWLQSTATRTGLPVHMLQMMLPKSTAVKVADSPLVSQGASPE